ncbi:MAG: DNA repair protein RadC [Bacteroidetes bacterium]|nr:DNA repair protein RadC [Bacteroidota bacterium]MDA1119176.1 DNA repair protein RadC [Bacteroidota bacterium]
MLKNSYKTNLTIKSWAKEDRPREKLVLKGKSSLSDAELIGILISSGTRDMSAVELAKQILAQVGNDINELAKLSVKDLEKFRGIGEAKAISIVSALELGRRRKDLPTSQKPKINSPADVYEIIKPELLDNKKEEFWILLLNRANVVIRKIQISSGGVAGTAVDPKLIFKHALDHLASGVILIHNHPSGNLKPSEADIKLTKKIDQAGKFLDIDILDHLIFIDTGYYSFKDEGLI